MTIDYYCLSCRRYISEGDVRTVMCVSRDGAFGAVIHIEPCGGDTLYYEPADDAFYPPIPEYIEVQAGDAAGEGGGATE